MLYKILKTELMIESILAITTSIVFLIIGVVSIIQPYKVKIWMNKGSAETINSDENKIYFLMVRFMEICLTQEYIRLLG